jgi:hypothetical protein
LALSTAPLDWGWYTVQNKASFRLSDSTPWNLGNRIAFHYLQWALWAHQICR